MTNEELAELKTLEQAATPGPWRGFFSVGIDTQWFDVEARGEEVLSAESEPSFKMCHIDGHKALEEAVRQKRADVNFVAAARTAVPALIAEVERLQAKWKREECAHCDERSGGAEGTIWCAECLAWHHNAEKDQAVAELRAEVERLRAALKPFAEYAQTLPSCPDSATIALYYEPGPAYHPTVGDLRRAAEALEGK